MGEAWSTSGGTKRSADTWCDAFIISGSKECAAWDGHMGLQPGYQRLLQPGDTGLQRVSDGCGAPPAATALRSGESPARAR